jgi:hypothetical protein
LTEVVFIFLTFPSDAAALWIGETVGRQGGEVLGQS